MDWVLGVNENMVDLKDRKPTLKGGSPYGSDNIKKNPQNGIEAEHLVIARDNLEEGCKIKVPSLWSLCLDSSREHTNPFMG